MTKWHDALARSKGGTILHRKKVNVEIGPFLKKSDERAHVNILIGGVNTGSMLKNDSAKKVKKTILKSPILFAIAVILFVVFANLSIRFDL